MADAKISSLTALTGANVAADDVLPIVDTSATTAGSKKIRADELAVYMESSLIAGSDTQILFNDGGGFGGDSALTWDKTNNKLTIASGTLTTSQPALNITQTWNAGAVGFTAELINITNTASSATSSYFADYQIGGSSIFRFRIDGFIQTPTGGGLASLGGVIRFYNNSGADLADFDANRSAFRAVAISTSPSGAYSCILTRVADGIIGVRAGSTTAGAALAFVEQTAPSAPATNGVYLYAEDNGGGKTRLMALFATGAAQQVAIEP
jgi:hypothetical protein